MQRRHLIFSFIFATIPTQGIAQKDDIHKVDSILDRLEQRLLDQESDTITFGDRSSSKNSDMPLPGGRLKFNRAQVYSSTAEQERLKTLGSLVSELEKQVEQLTTGIQKTKQGILDEAAIDNFVSLEAALTQNDQAAIKTLSVKLDGYTVYELNDASGLWIPAKIVPLYAGPLKPGNHRIDFESRLVLKHTTGLPLNSDMYRLISKSFDILVPTGTSNNRYVITIKPPAKLGDSADASLKELM